MAETIHIAIPADDKYWQYALVTARSAERGSSLPIEFHIIDGGISAHHKKAMIDALRSKIVFHEFDSCDWPEWHGSGITWSRLCLTELLPDIEWVLSADADVMFRGDVADLWRLRVPDALLMPSRDHPLPGHAYNEKAIAWHEKTGCTITNPADYFCVGLTLLNLAAMRKFGWSAKRDEMIRNLGRENILYPDQSVLNYLLQGQKELLPVQWGCFSGDENADIDWLRSGAVHFVEDTPWARRKCTHLMSDLVMEWWKIAESCRLEVQGFRGCKNWFDYAWRRAAFVFLKHNQWILKLHPKLWLHLRSTKGVRI